MSTRSFKDVQSEVADAEARPQLPAPVQQVKSVEDSDPSTDFAEAHLNILSKTSMFDVDGASVGDICLNKEIKIASEGEVINSVVVKCVKYFKENWPFGSDKFTRFAYTPEEIADLEETTECRKKNGQPDIVPVCDIHLLIEQPDSFAEEDAGYNPFLFDFGGRKFALAKYTVQKAAAVRDNYGSVHTLVAGYNSMGVDGTKFIFKLRSVEKGQGSPYKWKQFVLAGTTDEAPEGAVKFAQTLRGGGSPS